MFKLPEFIKGQSSQVLNLFRFFVLRNVLIAAAFLLIIYTSYSNSPLPIISISIILFSLLLVNLFTGGWLYFRKPVTDNTLMWQLVIDVTAFTGVLYFTGGASNPFGWFYLVPIFIAATLLPVRAIWLITSLSMIGYTALMFFYQPVAVVTSHNVSTAAHMQHNTGFQQHIIGMWLGYMLTALLVAYVVARMANSLREQDKHLAKAREKLLRDERLVALGTLAAGAAHELGTPLSTIAIVVKEMQSLPNTDESSDYLKIIRQQVDRCKQALTTLSHSAGEELLGGGEMLPVHQYVLNITRQWQTQRPATRLMINSNVKTCDAQILAEQTLTQGLINILNNAADASPEQISIDIDLADEELLINITDNGDGLDAMIHAHAGKRSYSSKEGGLGLGLFLAYSSIERLGGKVYLSNQENGGAKVSVTLPLFWPVMENKNVE